MIISRTPFRISFFGGGTDYPAWVAREGGAVLSATIDKYCYLTCRLLPPFFPTRHRVVWSHIETVNQISEILHPCVREGLRFLGCDDSQGYEIHHQGDLPARSGMGSSSSFAVGLIHAVRQLQGQSTSKEELARLAIHLEQVVLNENVGYQDQVAVAHGGLNHIQFKKSGQFEVVPINCSPQRSSALNSRLLLFYLGISRSASEIASQLVSNIESKAQELRELRELVEVGRNILEAGSDLDDFGRLLHESWLLKRSLASVISSEHVDAVYHQARQHGALGGKLLGAGGTGFMVFYVPPERQKDVARALGQLLHVPFRFEREGSIILQSLATIPPESVALPHG